MIRHPLPGATVTSPFGWRADPITGERQWHNGVDLGAPEGTPVRALADGTYWTFRDSLNGYGVRLAHEHPRIAASLYVHLSAYANIPPGTRVTAGQVIGYVGTTGLSTGPHLHLTVRGTTSADVPGLGPRVEIDPMTVIPREIPFAPVVLGALLVGLALVLLGKLRV